VKATVLRQPFGRPDIPTRAPDPEREARQHALHIDNHGARAARALIAALIAAGQEEGIPQRFEQSDAGLDDRGPVDAVDEQFECHLHVRRVRSEPARAIDVPLIGRNRDS